MPELMTHGVRYHRVVIAAFLTLAVVSCFQLRDIEIDNSVERWLGDNRESLAVYNNFLNQFGEDEFIVVGLVMDDPLSAPNLAFIDDFVQRVERVQGVENVMSLSQLGRALPGNTWPLEDELRRKLGAFASKSEIGSDMLISKDGHGAAIIVTIGSRESDRYRLVSELEAMAKDVRGKNGVLESHLAGAPAVANALDRMSRDGLTRFMPWVFGVAIAVTWMLLGSIWLVIACIVPAMTSVAITFAIFSILGFRLDLVTTIIAPLVFILSSSGAIHVVSHYRRMLSEGERGEKALISALQYISKPLLYINLTTTLGLLALLVSSIQQIRALGSMGAIGVAIGHGCALFFGGGLLALFRKRIELLQTLESGWGGRVTAICTTLHRKYALLLLGITVVLLVSGIVVAPHVKMNSRWLEHFPEDHPTRVATEYFGSQYAGLTPVEICFQLPPGAGPSDPESLSRIAEVEDIIREEGWITKTFSLAGLRRDVDLMFETSQEDSQAADLAWEFLLGNGPDWLKRTVKSYLVNDTARVRAISAELSSTHLLHSLASLERRLASSLPADTYQITGMVRLVLAMQEQLLTSQVRSFAVAFILILIVFLAVFRSMKFALIAILPNLLPLAAAILLLVLWGEPLNVATIMIASISMGIAVDSSIHFCSAYRAARKKGMGAQVASALATTQTAPAIATACVVVAFGFMTLAFADFWMIAIFGILVSFVMLVSLATSLLVVPVLLPRIDSDSSKTAALCAETRPV